MLNYIHSQSGDEFTNVYLSPPSLSGKNDKQMKRNTILTAYKERKDGEDTDRLKPLKLARQKHPREEMTFSLFLLK